MTPQQALQVLDQATSLLELKREAHNQILQALHVLESEVLNKEKKPEILTKVDKSVNK